MVIRTAPPATSSTDLALYTRCADVSTARIIGEYSTSFGLATRLFRPEFRAHIRNIYGLVRIADEIVDGAAAQAGVEPARQRDLLDELERDVRASLLDGYSANLVVHAFARTARHAGIDIDLITPFFASMRRDLDPAPMRTDEIGTYIYGSAEVVGLMCLRVFLVGVDVSPVRRRALEDGARHLGAAFQKINFLRDLASDYRTLGRNYFPGYDPETLSDEEKARLIDDIDQDIVIAGSVIADLPAGARYAVAAAHQLFSELTRRLRAVPAAALMSSRQSVPAWRKLRIFARALSRRLAHPGR